MGWLGGLTRRGADGVALLFVFVGRRILRLNRPFVSASAQHAISFSPIGERAGPPTIARLMAMALENPRLLSLAAGFIDHQTLPVEAVQAAVAALARRPGVPEYLQYGTNMGRPRLRRLLAARLQRWEPTLQADAAAERLFITNGSQQALYLAMQVLCDEDDIVLVDRPSYFVFLEMLTGLDVKARSLPEDGQGRLDQAGLRALLDRMESTGESKRLKAVYLVSYFANPSGRTMDAVDKAGLASALAERGLFLPVIEDAAYRELFFREPPRVPGVIGLEEWSRFPCLYLATLTKPFATGLKIGYGFCTSADWLARMLHVKGHHDFGSANFTQAILEEVLGNEVFERHLEKIRPVYEHKMRVLQETLRREGLDACGWRWSEPQGGLYLWLEGPTSLDTGMESAFCRACVEQGVLYVPGILCYGDEPQRNCVRLSFGVLDEASLREAGRRFVRVARRFG
jgi:2-aminoadipate transaminase